MINLPVIPIASTVVVFHEDGECRPPTGVKVQSHQVFLEDCDFGESLEDGKVEFEYYENAKNEFTLPAEFFEKEHAKQVWRVWVDGQLTTDYEVDGNSIRFHNELGAHQKVSIKVSLIKAI